MANGSLAKSEFLQALAGRYSGVRRKDTRTLVVVNAGKGAVG
jgi:hypothetical protein